MKIDKNLKTKLREHLMKKMAEEQKKVITIQTVYPLVPEELKQFEDKIPELVNYEVVNEVNTDLIGGFVIRHGSKIIDASVSSEINEIVSRLRT